MPAQYPLAGLSLHRRVGRHARRLLRGHRPHAGEPGDRIPRRLVPEYSSIKMPGLRKFTNVTLKRGVVKGDNEFFEWLSTVKLNTVERRDLIISLLNEEHEPVMVWKVHNAFPVKVEGPAAQGHRQRGGDRVDRDRPRGPRAAERVTRDARLLPARFGFHFKVEVLGLAERRRHRASPRWAGCRSRWAPRRWPRAARTASCRSIRRGRISRSGAEARAAGAVRGLRLGPRVHRGHHIEPKNVDVKLLNEEHEPLMTWHVDQAPSRQVGGISDFNATSNAVVIETLQLSYQYFTVDRS